MSKVIMISLRYDHYATMCELLPVSLPSLRCCLAVMTGKLASTTGGTLPVNRAEGEKENSTTALRNVTLYYGTISRGNFIFLKGFV